MKRLLLTFLCIAAISGAVFYFVSVPRDRMAAAVGGVADLRDADLDGAVYTLGGEWEFYWDKLYGPEDFADAERAVIPVPVSWNAAGYPRTGSATYRLTLLTPDRVKLAMFIPEILSASAVWVDGEKIFSAGTVGDRDTFATYAQNDIVVLPEGDVVEIVVQASNYEKINGGIRHPFRVGSESALVRAVFGRWLMLAGIAGAFFISGFYHLALFLTRRETRGDRIYLLFAASCVLVGLRLLTDQDSVASFFLRGALNAHLSTLYWAFFSLHSICINTFTLMVFGVELSRAEKRAYAVVLALPLVFLLVLPPPLSRFMQFSNIVSYFFTIFCVFRALPLTRVRTHPFLGLYFASLVVFLFFGLLVLPSAQISIFAGYTLHNTFLMLSQFVILTWDYAEARRKARELAEKNDFYHRMAHDLLTPLTVVSTNVQVAGMMPEKTPELLADTQDEIMKMARMIGDALDDAGEEPR